MNRHVGKVLYDTGCSYPVLVLTKHVKKSDIIRGTVLVRYANSCEDRLPIAWVDIETPYVKKWLKRLVLQHSLVTSCWAVDIFYLEPTLLHATEQQWQLLRFEHRSGKGLPLLNR